MKNHLTAYFLCVGTILGVFFSVTAQADSINAEVIDQYGTSWSKGAASNIFATVYDSEVDSPNSQGEKLIAPGTHGEYTFTIKNKENKSLTYVLKGKETNAYSVPIQYRYQLNHQFWLIGDEQSGVLGETLYPMHLKRTLPKYSEETITLTWEWPFERGRDVEDTVLGNQAVVEDEVYALSLSIQGETEEPFLPANPSDDYSKDTNTNDSKNNSTHPTGKNDRLPQTGEEKKNQAITGVGIVFISVSLYIAGNRRKNGHG